MTKKVKVILKHSSIEDKIPTAEQLEVGELALNNFKDKEFLSFKNTDGEVVKISPSGNKEVIQNLQNSINANSSKIKNISDSLANYDTVTNVDSKLAKKLDVSAYKEPDLSPYAKKSDIPSKTSQLTNDSGFITGVDLSNYDTITDVNSKLDTKLDATAYTKPDLSSYAKKTDVPTKTSELTNDSGYITGVDLSNYDTITDVNSKLEKKLDSTAYTAPDLSIYAKKSEIPTVPTKTSELENDSNYVTSTQLATKLDATAYTPTDLSSYAKKSDIPSVPTKTSELTNDSGFITGVDLSSYDTITDVNSKLANKLDATAYTTPDLSSYAKKTDIPTVPTKTSQLTNDSGFITGVDLSNYDTITDVDSKLSTKLDATAYTPTDLSSYAKKSDIPNKTSQLSNDSNYVTKTDLDKKLDATAYTAPDLSSYAKKSDIPTVPTKTSQLTNDSHYTKKVELTQAAYDALTSKDEDTIYVITDSNVESVTSDTLKDYAKKTDIPTVPTKTSQLTNDSNFITGVDLSNYATTTQLAEKQDKVNNIVVGKTVSYTLQSVTESEWQNLSGTADSNTIYFIK